MNPAAASPALLGSPCSRKVAVVAHSSSSNSSSRHCHSTRDGQRQQRRAARTPARPRAPRTAHSRPSDSAGPAARPADAAPQQCSGTAVPAAAFLLAQLAGPAGAATVCIDVPDWLADWRSTLLHSPVLAVGVAAGALLLAPKLIRGAITYLALPAVAALLAYGAVSFPEQTASTVYSVLEFVREHPAVSSAGIVVAAGALLGPDLLAAAAVAGAVLLLSVNLGFVQLPKLPALPALPGQRLLASQLDKTGRALRDKLDDLDDDGGGRGSSSRRSSSWRADGD